ncbi:DEAD/DEAH box helicase [Acholeplasma laidlawii]|uniref:DEAD/DEAH box helicase n=1 Tax=Acholeplasma laidlawii TaxID=2148 RepID=UPI00084C72F6|nr:DEAD/DEAH box helicase [Acholeplasma laidlawii]OED28963.1 DEAD/DEAH box helicase [Acholeplasma laidlawii]
MKFSELNIIERIQKALTLSGYEAPTAIQEQAIPILLSGQDLLGSAQTGTGKTAAFAIPILQKIYETKEHKAPRKVQALILTPTRELALQIHENVKIYAKYLNIISTTIYGGVSQKRQEEALKRGVDVVIATPGRLLDLMNQKIISLQDVRYLVLDEADQMLDMGFIKDVTSIVDKTPKKRQTMLFSATMPKQIEVLSKQILVNPERIAVTPVTQTLDAITQSVYMVNKANKTLLLIDLIYTLNMKSVLVFTKTKHGANKLVKNLMNLGIESEPIHGSKSQAARERALANFKKGKTKILVATDIAARGIDIEALDYVINFELPEVPETYIHRIGRTGRAGLSGMALSLVDPSEQKLLTQVEKHINSKIEAVGHKYQIQSQPKQREVITDKLKTDTSKKQEKPKKNCLIT